MSHSGDQYHQEIRPRQGDTCGYATTSIDRWEDTRGREGRREEGCMTNPLSSSGDSMGFMLRGWGTKKYELFEESEIKITILPHL